MTQDLEIVLKDGLAAIDKAANLTDLEETEKEYIGRKGKLSEFFKKMGAATPEEKKELGQTLNKVKTELEGKVESKRSLLKKAALAEKLEKEWIDVTLPGEKPNYGHVHPLTQVYKDVEQIFGQMGFAVVDGPEVESEYYNFEALNIPETHPARDMQDTFFIDKAADEKHRRLVLRTHTSPNQIRSMETYGAPLRIIVPGRVFRYEATDATHETTFDQVEGLLIDKDISLADLKGIMVEFLSRLFGKEMKVRFRPGYFPFVEPGIELDISCPFCKVNEPCKVCKGQRYIEFMGAGMVHPKVLEYGGIDPNEYQGWAFGFGLTRLAMMKYKIDDIRHLLSGDLRFNKQF